MKRILFLLSAWLLLALLLCGCDAQPEATEPPVSLPENYMPTYVETDSSYYDDGSPAALWEFVYDLEGTMLSQSWECFFPDGTPERSGYYKLRKDGSITESQETVYYENGTLQSQSAMRYDSELDAYIHKTESYFPDGTPRQYIDGTFDSSGGNLLFGILREYHDSGELSYSHEITDEVNTESSYDPDGTLIFRQETVYTRDAAGNIVCEFTDFYNKHHGILAQETVSREFDANGNMVWEHSYYDENGKRITEDERTWAYDSQGRVVELTELSIVRQQLQSTIQTHYTYNSAGLLAEENTVLISGSDTFRTHTEYIYDENGQLLEAITS